MTRIVDDSAIKALDRVRHGTDGAIRRGLQKAGLFLGRKIAENIFEFKETLGTNLLARSFLVPVVEAVRSVILGRGAPIYASIHEYGGIIEAKDAKALAFEVNGELVFAKRVKIKEKRYARDAIEETSDEAAQIMGLEIAHEFAGMA